MNYTEEQLLAINKEGSNIIVSAGAGSGKTAVLTERVIRKLKDGVSIDRLLVLTFTNEAANEMKNRIRNLILKNKLDSQLELINSAFITTFDSYALSLVKKYHYILNVSRNLGIIQDGILDIKRQEFIDKIFDDSYGNEDFETLINTFSLKDDSLLKKFILEILAKVDLKIDKEDYLDNYMANYYNDNYLSNLVLTYNEIIKLAIDDLNNIYHEFINYAPDGLINKLDSYFKPLFDGNNYDEYRQFSVMPAVRFVGVSEEGLASKDKLKTKIDEIKNLLRFEDTNDILNKILVNKKNMEVIIKIVKELDVMITNYKREVNMYEFNDISHMALKIVNDNYDIKEEIKEYFNEIMVDEYQDTSDIQEEFIKAISNNNVYMVGDIKQSIYRFRNANPYIFQEKYDKYSKGDNGYKIDLLNNFRSRKETVYNINELFNLIMDNEIGGANYLESHNMVFGNKGYLKEDTKHNNYMEIYNYTVSDLDKYSREEKEAFIVAEDIINKVNSGYLVFDKKTSKLRNIEYSDICIITDRNKNLALYKKIFEYKGIPAIIYMDQEINNDMVVMVLKNLISLVNYVNNNDFGVEFKYAYTSVARSVLFDYDDKRIYDDIKNNKYYESEIVKLAREIDINESLAVIVNDIIDKYAVYQKLVNLYDIEENIVRIDNVINIASNLNDMGYNLSEFVNYLSDMFNLDLAIKYSTKGTNAKAVKMMNIHKSKGLEFNLCYFLGMHNKFSFRDISSKFLVSNSYGIILPYLSDTELCDSILKDLYKYEYYKEEISEKIRLLYVALTRAKEKIIIVTNMEEEYDGYNHLVPVSDRLKYRSFLDILKTVANMQKYIVNKEAEYSKDYNLTKISMKKLDKSNDVITKKRIDINYDLIKKTHYSKENNKVFDLDTLKSIEFGTKLHEIMEYDDFNNPQSEYVIDFLKLIPKGFINVYHEYEFIFNENDTEFHGIIDLMVEYEDKIYIIDYKTSKIDDDNYIKQVHGYADYLKTITNKDIKTFLYSIVNEELLEV